MRFGENVSAPLSPPLGTSLIDNLLKVGSGVLTLINQQQLAKANLSLIKEGKQPIPVSAVPGLTPTISVQGGLDSGTRNMLLLGAAGLGAFLLLGRRRRR